MNADKHTLRIGTRTSKLARVQTDLFIAALRARSPEARYEVVGVTTRADRTLSIPIPDLGQGAFVKELEAALLAKEIDLAVHSLKDLPTELPPGLRLAAVLTREDPRDVLVSRNGWTLDTLPRGARVGTGSPRRGAQLLARRPDLRIVLLRGNVDTRLRKVLEDGEAEAAVLAAAGLIRLGITHVITQYFEPTELLPAIGQGFMAVECREDDAETRAFVESTEDPDARRAADAERAFLAGVGGGCKAPLGAYATTTPGGITLEGLVASLDGKQVLRDRVAGSFSPNQAGTLLKERLFARGAAGIIAAEERAGA